jgi:putative SOS response-associated peptidase YedK
MCGRFTATFEFNDIRGSLELRPRSNYAPRFNVAPETSANVPVIIRQKGGNECRLMQWGLIPHWAANPSIGNRMINARAEILTELPSFKLLVDRRRCIIPADGFYEWRKEASGGSQCGCISRIGSRLVRWPMGRVAQAGWEARGVVHDHHDGA